MTTREILQKTASWLAGKGFESARLEAELLLAHLLSTDRVGLYVDPDRPLTGEEIDAYRDLIRRRAGGEPVAYLTGQREFFGLQFEVTPAVLVPRPETEMLVDRARQLNARRLLDLCTGSGCVAVTCAVRLPETEVVATDLSAAALEVARRNAATHGVENRVRFLEGDLFEALGSDDRFDLITANPPYVPQGQAAAVALHEPQEALFAGADGMAILRRLIGGAPARLEPGGTLLVEIGEDQEVAVRAETEPLFASVEIHRDLAGHPRILEARG